MECAMPKVPAFSVFENCLTVPHSNSPRRETIFSSPFSNMAGQEQRKSAAQENNDSLASNSINLINSTFDIIRESELLQPLFSSGDSPTDEVLPVECGVNAGLLFLSKLCQGSKGHCILYRNSWLTPNEFQLISGRVTAKDWKRSIRHNGKSLKLLISKGALTVHSPLCDCGNHQQEPQRMELLDQLNYNNANGLLNNHHHKLLSTTSAGNKRMNGGNTNGGVKRETRLTSIIDSLLVKSHEGSQSCSSSESEFGFEIPSAPLTGRSESSKRLSPPLDRKVGRSGESRKITSNSPRSTESGEEESPSSDPVGTLSANHSSSMPGLIPTTTSTSSATTTVLNQPTPKSRTSKKQRAPPIKTERQSPESVRSSPSPSKPPSNGGGSRGASPPLRQMEQMMGRNCSDIMRSLAAKYQHANPNDLYARSSPFNFDSRFLKPGAAAAAASLFAFQQQHADKFQFPLIDMSSTQTLLSMVRSAAASGTTPIPPPAPPTSNGLNPPSGGGVKRATSPLDLSSAAALVGLSAGSPPKKSKSNSGNAGTSTKRCGSNCSGCSAEGEAIVSGWTVDDVCRFVGSIDLCAEYIQAFRDHSIDGSSLPLLTEEHLIQNMSMKLGPALKFKSTVAKKLGNCPICRHCAHCHLPAEAK